MLTLSKPSWYIIIPHKPNTGFAFPSPLLNVMNDEARSSSSLLPLILPRPASILQPDIYSLFSAEYQLMNAFTVAISKCGGSQL